MGLFGRFARFLAKLNPHTASPVHALSDIQFLCELSHLGALWSIQSFVEAFQVAFGGWIFVEDVLGEHHSWGVEGPIIFWHFLHREVPVVIFDGDTFENVDKEGFLCFVRQHVWSVWENEGLVALIQSVKQNVLGLKIHRAGHLFEVRKPLAGGDWFLRRLKSLQARNFLLVFAHRRSSRLAAACAGLRRSHRPFCGPVNHLCNKLIVFKTFPSVTSLLLPVTKLMFKLVALWTLLALAAALGTVDVSLEAPWGKTPFKLQVLEAYAAHNTSLYAPLVEKLLGIAREGDDLVFQEDNVVEDDAFYAYAQSLVENADSRALLGVEVANNVLSPLVQAHYAHYAAEVKPHHSCERDVVLVEGNKGESYCESDAAFVLKTIEVRMAIKDVKLPIDHILGRTYSTRVYTIYGDYRDSHFREMFFNMYQLVEGGDVTLIWRYAPGQDAEERELLSAYGVELNIKNTTYVSIDVRQTVLSDDDESAVDKEGNVEADVAESAEQNVAQDFTGLIRPPRFVEFINYQFTHYILHMATDKLTTLVEKLAEFPRHAFDIGSRNYDFQHLTNVEQESDKVRVPTGMYINGAFVTDTKVDLFEILATLKRELSFVDMFKSLGVNVTAARDLMGKFASAVFEPYNTPLRRYNLSHVKQAIGYFNDIEKDDRYASFGPTRKVYKKGPPQGQLPLARENIYDMVFVLDLTDKLQLKYLLECVNRVLESTYPIRIGIIPLRDASEYSAQVTAKFYATLKVEGPSAALSYLNMLNMLINGKEGLNLMTLRALDAPQLEDQEKALVNTWLDKFYQDFSIVKTEPLIIADGVMFPYSDINAAMNQLFGDLAELLEDYHSKTIPENAKFSKYLRRNAVGVRNSRVIPQSLGGFRSTYSDLPLQKMYPYAKELDIVSLDLNESAKGTPVTVNLVGSLESGDFISQIKELLKFSKHYKAPLRVRIAELSGSDQFTSLVGSSLTEFKDAIASLELNTKPKEALAISVKTFVNSMFGITHASSSEMTLVIAGRKIPVNGVFIARELLALVQFEVNTRLTPVAKLIEDIDFSVEITDVVDRLDYLAWALSLTYFYYQPEYYLSEAFPRIATDNLPYSMRIDSDHNSEEASIEVNLVIDPVSEAAQKFTSFIPLLESLDFVNLSVYLKPNTRERMEELPIKRFYRTTYQTEVDANADRHVMFTDVPEKTLLSLGIDSPQRWLVTTTAANTDLDNIRLDTVDTDVKAVFGLQNILVDGYAYYDFRPGVKIAPAGVGLELRSGDKILDDTNVMANYGYFQLKALPGSYDVAVKKGVRGGDVFKMVTTNKVWVTSFEGSIVRPALAKQPGKENVELIKSPRSKPEEPSLVGRVAGFFSSMLAPSGSQQAEVNVFSLASGHLYERLLKTMMASVMKNTGSTVKFWLLENYMSPELKESLPAMSEYYGFKYELLTYKWPIWLQAQTERQRIMWGYKMLFLDVLFPQDLNKVIFVDADATVRADLKELVDEDLQGAPYGFTPICESRDEMEGYQFWKQGYWAELLGDNFKYHTSSLYVVDLHRFREVAAGDHLRQQYRVLSQDPESLSNLDQDLPNSLQRILPIHSLDQSWLWCESWCDAKSLANAKVIDLCNNPATKESKLECAKRQLPEWEKTDVEVSKVIDGSLTHERWRDEL